MTSDVGRLVIRAPNWLGDAIMALPAMAAVRAALPETFIAVAAVPAIAPMFREATTARTDAAITVDGRSEPDTLCAGRFDAGEGVIELGAHVKLFAHTLFHAPCPASY